jgi:hypothetical protein
MDHVMTYSISVAYFYGIGFIFEFSSAAMACCERFRIINERINKNANEIQWIIQLYQKLLKVLEHINEKISPLLIPLMLWLLITQTFMIYTVVRLLLKTSTKSNRFHMIFLNILYSFVYVYLIAVPCYAAECAYKEGMKFKEICYEILCSKKISNIAAKDLKLYVDSINESKLQLQTFFFNIDWKLWFQVRMQSYIFKFK